MWKKFKEELIKLLEKEQPEIYKIPRFIDADSVLRLIPGKGWYVGKKRLSPEDTSVLKAEAADFSKSYLWKLMRNDIHYVAYLQATAKRRTDEDAIYAGAMYKDLEILEQFIEEAKKL